MSRFVLSLLLAVSPTLVGASEIVFTPAVLSVESSPDGGTQLLRDDAWSFDAFGSYAFGDSAGEIGRAHFGAGQHLTDSLVMHYDGFVGGHHRAARDGLPTARGFNVGFDAILRWHYHSAPRWSAYLEGGVGAAWFEDTMPARGSQFNFQPQFGLGVTLPAGARARFLLGVRWLHVSHAGVSSRDNPGYDGPMPYFGVLYWP